MTKEDKELLLKDLCARLPYGFVIHRESDNSDIKINYIDDFSHFLDFSDGEDFKPYLRPMSSMTEEEKKELNCIGYIVPLYDGCFGVDMRAYCKNGQPHYRRFSEFSTIEDWLNKHHFDYRTIYDEDKKKYMSMIEKGLALEAPEGMYDI